MATNVNTNEITIAGKKYYVPEFTFKHLPIMEKSGLPLTALISGDFIFTTVQVFISIVAKCSTDEADKIAEKHIMDGGSIEPLFEAFSNAIEESGFFTKLLENMSEEEE